MSIAGCHLSASSWSSSAPQVGKGCTMNTLHPACKVTLVRKTSAKGDFSQAMLSIAYKLNCTLQSETHDVTVRSHAHSAGEYASEVERAAPCYISRLSKTTSSRLGVVNHSAGQHGKNKPDQRGHRTDLANSIVQ